MMMDRLSADPGDTSPLLPQRANGASIEQTLQYKTNLKNYRYGRGLAIGAGLCTLASAVGCLVLYRLASSWPLGLTGAFLGAFSLVGAVSVGGACCCLCSGDEEKVAKIKVLLADENQRNALKQMVSDGQFSDLEAHMAKNGITASDLQETSIFTGAQSSLFQKLQKIYDATIANTTTDSLSQLRSDIQGLLNAKWAPARPIGSMAAAV